MLCSIFETPPLWTYVEVHILWSSNLFAKKKYHRSVKWKTICHCAIGVWSKKNLIMDHYLPPNQKEEEERTDHCRIDWSTYNQQNMVRHLLATEFVNFQGQQHYSRSFINIQPTKPTKPGEIIEGSNSVITELDPVGTMWSLALGH